MTNANMSILETTSLLLTQLKALTAGLSQLKEDNQEFKRQFAMINKRFDAQQETQQEINSYLMKKISANDVAPLTDQTTVITETAQTDSTEKVTVFAPQLQNEDAAIAEIESVVQHDAEGSNSSAAETIQIDQTELATKAPVNPTIAKVTATYANVNGINDKVYASEPNEIQVDTTGVTVHATATMAEAIQGFHIPIEAEPPPMISPYAECPYQDDSYPENVPIMKFFQAWHSPLWTYWTSIILDTGADHNFNSAPCDKVNPFLFLLKCTSLLFALVISFVEDLAFRPSEHVTEQIWFSLNFLKDTTIRYDAILFPHYNPILIIGKAKLFQLKYSLTAGTETVTVNNNTFTYYSIHFYYQVLLQGYALIHTAFLTTY